MKINVFMKSVLRQPVRTILLAVLMLAAAFALVARVTEFIIVNDAINHIEGQYRATGNLVPILPQNVTQGHDVTRAAEIVSNSPMVAGEDTRVFAQGVMDGVLNTSGQFVNLSSILQPANWGLPITTMEFYLIARITNELTFNNLGTHGSINISIFVEELLAGDPMVIPPGERYAYNVHGRRVDLPPIPTTMSFILTAEEAELFEAGLHPMNDMAVGNTYLFRAGGARVWYGARGNAMPLIGSQTISQSTEDLSITIEKEEGTIFFVDTADVVAYNAVREQIQPRIDSLNHNMSSMLVIGTKSMADMPRMSNPRSARLSTGQGVPGGRWLTYDDYLNQNPVAVVPMHLATRRGLRVGDTITLTLQNAPMPTWMNEREGAPPWTVGGEGWWHSSPQGWWATTEDGLDWQSFETHELELTIVGIYWNTPIGVDTHNYLNTEMYIPLSLIPDGFVWESAPILASQYNFTLHSSRDIDRFVQQYGAQLRALGFRVNFMPNGFENFASAADPIRASIMVNLIIFSIVAALILAMVVFLYLRQWRSAVAVSRALGAPAAKSMRHLFTPVFLIWTPAIIIGSFFAWNFAVEQSRTALGGLEEFVIEEQAEITAETALDIRLGWTERGDVVFDSLDRAMTEPFIFAGGIVLITFAGLIITGLYQARKPVLEQLQGGTTKRRKKKYIADGDGLLEGFASSVNNLDLSPLKTTKKAARGAVFGHIWKHIMRSPIKSALVAIIAMFFVVALGWLNHSIEFTEAEIERLWDTTIVNAELVLEIPEEEVERASWTWAEYFGLHIAPISQRTIDHYLASGYFMDIYLEALWPFGSIRAENDTRDLASMQKWRPRKETMIGVSSLEGFIQENTRTDLDDALGILGESIEIEFLEGFSEADFAFGGSDAPMPMIISRAYFDRLMDIGFGSGLGAEAEEALGWEAAPPFAIGDYLRLSDPDVRLQIVGIFDYGLNRGINRFENWRNVVIVPLDALGYHTYDSWLFGGEEALLGFGSSWDIGGLTYMTARVDINPARNRELASFRDFMGGALELNHLGRFFGAFPLEMFMTDGELYSVIEPLEQNLVLMRLLYPITIGVAIALSIGLSLIIMLHNAKNAALMRMLGKTRGKTQTALGSEQIIIIIAGVVLGILSLIIIGVPAFKATPLFLAAMYFAGAIAGSVLGAIIIYAKTPLELLQTKE